jgi:hypothetical protein
MVKIDNFQHQPNQKETKQQTDHSGFDNQTNQLNNQTQTNQKQSSGLLTMIGQLLPLAPFAFEQFTGQKVPHLTGTIAEMQMALIQIQTGLQTIVNNQQSLSQRLIQLETNAGNQLTNLTQQFNSLRLTHTQEKKQIEFNPSKLENQTDY